MKVLNHPEITFEKLPVTVFKGAGAGAI